MGEYCGSAGTRSGQTLQYNIIIRNTVVNGERTNELEVTGGWWWLWRCGRYVLWDYMIIIIVSIDYTLTR